MTVSSSAGDSIPPLEPTNVLMRSPIINPKSEMALLTSFPSVRFMFLIPSIPLAPFVITTIETGSIPAPPAAPPSTFSLLFSPTPKATPTLDTGIMTLSSTSIGSPMKF